MNATATAATAATATAAAAATAPCGYDAQPAILAAAPRCGARTRSGAACQSPAIRGGHRCRMHGGRGSGAPRGNRNAWKHGLRSAPVRAIARYLRATRSGLLSLMLAPRLPADFGRGAIAPKMKFAEQPHAPGKRTAFGVPHGDIAMEKNGAPGTIRTSDPQIRSVMPLSSLTTYVLQCPLKIA